MYPRPLSLDAVIAASRLNGVGQGNLGNHGCIVRLSLLKWQRKSYRTLHRPSARAIHDPLIGATKRGQDTKSKLSRSWPCFHHLATLFHPPGRPAAIPQDSAKGRACNYCHLPDKAMDPPPATLCLPCSADAQVLKQLSRPCSPPQYLLFADLSAILTRPLRSCRTPLPFHLQPSGIGRQDEHRKGSR